MKFRIGAYLMMLAGVTMLFSACGGGGNGGGGPVPITVTALRNPLLVGYSTTVVANFANYTSTIKFGSTVNFAVSSPPATFSNVSSAITTRSVKTRAGGLAWLKVYERPSQTGGTPLPGRFTISASSGNFAGSTTVSFINQPATVQVLAGLNKPITNLGGLSFNVKNDLPGPTYINFSTSVKGPNVTVRTLPIIPPPVAAGVTTTSVILTAVPGVNAPSGTLFRLNYLVVSQGVPIFIMSDLSAYLADAGFTPVTPDFFFTVTYYDSVGTKLYP